MKESEFAVRTTEDEQSKVKSKLSADRETVVTKEQKGENRRGGKREKKTEGEKKGGGRGAA